jgi:hypothetical protein
MRSPAGTRAFAPTLPHRTVPSVHPEAPVASSAAPRSALPEPPQWTVGPRPIPPRRQTLVVPERQAPLQRPHRYPAALDQATAAGLASRPVSGVSRLLVSGPPPSAGPPWPAQRPLGRVAPPGGLVLCEAPPPGRHGGRGCPLASRGPPGARATGRAKGVGTPRPWAPPAA